MLLLLQPLAIGATLALVVLLMDTTRWIALVPALALLIIVWFGQAIHAHQRAVALGRQPGGEMQAAWLLPVILVLITAFWLFGGEHASPAAALQEYVAAWRAGRTDAAAELFVKPPPAERLAAAWAAQHVFLRERVDRAARTYGAASGLDPESPFGALRFVELQQERTPDTALVVVDIVRRQRVEETLFGLIPTATQETVLVERAGIIRLRAVPAQLPEWLPLGRPPPRLWRIEQVYLPPDRPVTVVGPLADIQLPSNLDNGIVMV